MTMTPEDKKLLADHIKGIAKIVYKNTPPEKIETFEGIETTVRDQVLEHVSPQITFFSSEKRQEQNLAFFLDNFSIINWVNTQNLARTVYCLGDGHDGVWNLFAQIADDQTRQEILDWYHLKENLYKIQASKKFLEQIEADLWQGCGEEAISQLRKTKYVGVTNFISYLRKHRHRLVNYMYFLFRAIKLDWFGSCRVGGQANRQAATNSWCSMEVGKFTANATTALRLPESTTCSKGLKRQKIVWKEVLGFTSRVIRANNFRWFLCLEKLPRLLSKIN
jgi:hypothetical protein